MTGVEREREIKREEKGGETERERRDGEAKRWRERDEGGEKRDTRRQRKSKENERKRNNKKSDRKKEGGRERGKEKTNHRKIQKEAALLTVRENCIKNKGLSLKTNNGVRHTHCNLRLRWCRALPRTVYRRAASGSAAAGRVKPSALYSPALRPDSGKCAEPRPSDALSSGTPCS